MRNRGKEERVIGANFGSRSVSVLAFLHAALLASLLLCAEASWAQSGEPQEHLLVKAGYVLKIPLFIEWPVNQWKKPDDPIVIGVLGDTRMLKYLNEVAKNSAASGQTRTVQIKEYTRESIATEARPDVLFITGALCEAAESILRTPANKAIMSVSDCKNFIKAGGMFRLLRNGPHIALEANRSAIENAGMVMSFRLASVAKVVTPATSAP